MTNIAVAVSAGVGSGTHPLDQELNAWASGPGSRCNRKPVGSAEGSPSTALRNFGVGDTTCGAWAVGLRSCWLRRRLGRHPLPETGRKPLTIDAGPVRAPFTGGSLGPGDRRGGAVMARRIKGLNDVGAVAQREAGCSTRSWLLNAKLVAQRETIVR